jgi:hypothetical protein
MGTCTTKLNILAHMIRFTSCTCTVLLQVQDLRGMSSDAAAISSAAAPLHIALLSTIVIVKYCTCTRVE